MTNILQDWDLSADVIQMRKPPLLLHAEESVLSYKEQQEQNQYAEDEHQGDYTNTARTSTPSLYSRC